MDFESFKEQYQTVPVEHYSSDVPGDPKVSVCVPTYQHADYIEDCLEGILMQETNFSYEILLGEDASTDGTREICIEYAEKYPRKIRLFLHRRENNIQIGGQPTGRFNLLYNLYSARGRYTALCEGDDYWTDPLKLQKQVDYLNEHPDVGIVHTKYIIENEILNTHEVQERRIFDSNFSEFKNYLYTGDMRTLTVMFRSEYLSDIEQLFRTEILEKSPIGDRPIFLTIASKSSIGYINSVMGIYREHQGGSATRYKDLRKKYKSAIKVNKLNIELLSYLDINDKRYYCRRKRKLLRAQIFLYLFKIPFFDKIYDIAYKKMGLGRYKSSGYY